MKRSLILVFAASLAASALAQGSPETVSKIIAEGKGANKTRYTLERITGEFGARLTSSTHLADAQKWAMEQFKSFGCTNVHLEKWGEWPVGFDRAKTGHVGRMTAPFSRDFEFTTASWTPGTNGLKKGPAVMEPKTMADLDKIKGKLKGAWLIKLATPDAKPEDRAKILEAAHKAGILGEVTGSRSELVLTGGRYNIEWGKLPTAVQITIRKSDFDAVTAEMPKGKVELEFDLKQTMRKGPVPNYNVVAEIKGTEKPDEVVIVSGHYDSWDGPMSQGALDNGTGSSVTLEAARLLNLVGAKPKRTIRFILWSGEEQGLFGSRAYVKDHAAEMDKISTCLVDDGGTNYWGGFVGLETQRSFFQSSIDALNAAFPDLPMKFNAVAKMPRGGGSDHASFNAVGVPGFFTMETGVSDYNYVHHTQHDRIEAAINAYLVQSSTAAAVTAYNLACADTMLPREPKTGN
ncbi:MAG: M20/M25/M40 family metallo-hydrolase [Armatimonadetes bacterium]|nr:M20/M25/M40 family metallo-hydrolase [Armatimonadota bacterium]